MKLYIKNKFISLGGSSTVVDENDQPVYFVKGKMFSFKQTKEVQDLDGKVLYKVKNKLITFLLNKCYIYDGNDKEIGLISQRLSISQNFDMEGFEKPLTIEGNFWGWNFNVVYDGKVIASIQRVFALTDTFQLDIIDESQKAFLVALVIALDNIYDKATSQTSSD